MTDDKRKRWFALFIMVMFVGSSLAFAIQFAAPQPQQPTQQQELPTVVEKPLTDAEEAPYIQRGFIVVRYFYYQGCPDCAQSEAAVNALREDPGNVLLERIDIDQWPEAAAAVGLGANSAPAIYLKGASTRLLTGAIAYTDLFNAACPVYYNPPAGC